MMKILQFLTLSLLCKSAVAATITVGSWVPIFKGVELASGQQQALSVGELNQQVLCLRVDLTDPDVALLTTPRCTNCIQETLSENTSHFLEQYGLQVAVNGGFFSTSTGPTDAPLGTPDDVYGLAISQGDIVSPADDPGYVATLLFSTNNTPFFVPTNSPATNTAGLYTAISGNRPLLLGGTNVIAANTNDLDPRSALGLSQDRRYLFLMTIDGRQNGWSDGANLHDTGEWLKRFGATDAINVDGGGSTTMVQANCTGNAVRLNRSSYAASYGRERRIGHHFGVYAKPLPSELKTLNVEAGSTTAVITWATDEPATTQVEYSASTNYDSATQLDARLLRRHVATLAGLSSGSNYFFRAISSVSGQSYTQACQFSTITSLATSQIFDLTNVWAYTTNNLDGVNWTSSSYDDTNWLGSGPGLLYVEDAAYVAPKSTTLPPPFGQPIPRTYYFRTHFLLASNTPEASLTFSNFLDDGAVFYLNGAEVYRLRMPGAPTNIFNATLAIGSACTGTSRSGDTATNCPDVFVISGNRLTNLVQGDNVLAVEAHNFSAGSPDIVFGSALFYNIPTVIPPHLYLWTEGELATFFWNGEGFTLQQSSDLSSSNYWAVVEGPVTQSPFSLTNRTTMFYRLRR